MIEINVFCEYLYASSYIPIYLYDGTELTASYPDQDQGTLPPPTYLTKLWEAEKSVTYTLTEFYSYYGCIKIKDSNSCIVIGPVNDFPYSPESLLAMSKEFSIAKSDFDSFTEFFRNIPTQNLDNFIKTLMFLHYAFNHTQITRQEVEHAADHQMDKSINQKYTESSYEAKEEGLLNNSYAIEKELVRFIESGNLEGLKKFASRARNTKVGIIAHNNLRQWKNMFIVAVILYSRAAMKGGLTPSLSYQLSNIYMQQVERLTDVEDVKSLFAQVQMDYTNRVANSIVPITADKVLHQVVQFVRENTNRSITVAAIAEHVGFSRPSLSRKVKKELGFELSTFIKKCKLEEAKDLLAFTDKSLSEISNYLCFSSQSHFQKSFKDQYGITPHAYRKSVHF
ncbi:helix-turn-helix domain-containing protein [Paenibacillus illinoisensis]|uniref:Helix-turn-helix domain-containing protein n=1 Tax=Paenibacillus illinoisensis TaxID=59845 RepID=A0ABW8HRE6_9BACL